MSYLGSRDVHIGLEQRSIVHSGLGRTHRPIPKDAEDTHDPSSFIGPLAGQGGKVGTRVAPLRTLLFSSKLPVTASLGNSIFSPKRVFTPPSQEYLLAELHPLWSLMLTAPPRTLRCPSLRARRVAPEPPSPHPGECRQPPHPKAPHGPLPGTLPEPLVSSASSGRPGVSTPQKAEGRACTSLKPPPRRHPLPRNAPSPDHAVRALADVLQLRVARAHVERLPLHYLHFP